MHAWLRKATASGEGFGAGDVQKTKDKRGSEERGSGLRSGETGGPDSDSDSDRDKFGSLVEKMVEGGGVWRIAGPGGDARGGVRSSLPILFDRIRSQDGG